MVISQRKLGDHRGMRDYATREEVRDAILDATDKLLALYGYKKMTIDDLAQTVGIGKGTIYLHFSSKEEIVLSHIDRIIDRLRNELLGIAEQDLPADKKLERMLLLRVMFRFDSVQHYTLSLNDLLAAIRPQLLNRRRLYFEAEARIFSDVLAEGKRKGVLVVDDVFATAEAFLIATNSLLPYSLSTQELGGRGAIAEKTERLSRLLLNSIRRQPE